MPAGRPSDYTEEFADKIAEAVAESERGLEWLCDHRDDFPHPATVWRWVSEHPEFREKITRAKERQAEHLVYGGLRVIQEADKESSSHVQAARNEAEYRLKMVAKTAPRTMSDKHRVQVGGDPDSPPISTTSTTFDASALSDEERAIALKVIHAGIQKGAGK